MRSGALFGAIFGASVFASAASYQAIYATSHERKALQATYGSSHGIAALFGPAHDLNTVAGFSSFKVSMTLMILGSLYGLFSSTRLLRGEEELGRTDLILAGPTTLRRTTVWLLLSLMCSVVVLWLATAVVLCATSHLHGINFSVSSSFMYATAISSPVAMFMAVGAISSQVASNRRQAVALGGGLLGVSYGMRLVGDSGIGAHVVTWFSPLGWVEIAGGLVRGNPASLVPVVALVVCASWGAIVLSGQRDVGAGLLPDRTHRPARLGLLTGPIGLTVRLTLFTMVMWCGSIGGVALLYGLVATSAGKGLAGSLHSVVSKLTQGGTGTRGILGVCFEMLLVLVALCGASQIAAVSEDETRGTAEHLLVRLVSRTRWLVATCVVGVCVICVASLFAAVCGFIGTSVEHSDVSWREMSGAGVNLIAPAVVIFACGICAFGWLPRWATQVTYAAIGWSIMTVIIGGFGAPNHLLVDTSVFHYVSAAPAQNPRMTSDLVMLAVGGAMCAVGWIGLVRRDVRDHEI